MDSATGSGISTDQTPAINPIPRSETIAGAIGEKAGIMKSFSMFGFILVLILFCLYGLCKLSYDHGVQAGQGAVDAYLKTVQSVGVNNAGDKGQIIKCLSPVVRLFSSPAEPAVIYQEELVQGPNPRNFFIDGANLDNQVITITYRKGQIVPEVEYKAAEVEKVRHWYKLWL